MCFVYPWSNFFTGSEIRRQKQLPCLSNPEHTCRSEPSSDVNLRNANNKDLLATPDNYKYNIELIQTNKLKIFTKICSQQFRHHLKHKNCII